MARLEADQPFIHRDCQITGSHFGAYVEIGARSRIATDRFGAHSYCTRPFRIPNA